MKEVKIIVESNAFSGSVIQPKGQTFKKLSLPLVHLVHGCYLKAHIYWLLFSQTLPTFPGIDSEEICLRGGSPVFGETAVNSRTTWNRDLDSTLFCLLNISCSWEKTVHHTESGNTCSGWGICSALTFGALNYVSSVKRLFFPCGEAVADYLYFTRMTGLDHSCILFSEKRKKSTRKLVNGTNSLKSLVCATNLFVGPLSCSIFQKNWRYVLMKTPLTILEASCHCFSPELMASNWPWTNGLDLKPSTSWYVAWHFKCLWFWPVCGWCHTGHWSLVLSTLTVINLQPLLLPSSGTDSSADSAVRSQSGETLCGVGFYIWTMTRTHTIYLFDCVEIWSFHITGDQERN